MPDELMYDNVYDKKKDLVGGSENTNNKLKKTSSLVWLFWLLFTISFVVVLFSLMVTGWNILFYIYVIIWFFFAFKLFAYKKGKGTIARIFLYFFVFIIISIVYLFAGVKTDEATPVSQSADCKTLAQEYDGKVFTISSSDKLKGKVGFKIDKSSCAYEITWHTLFESGNIVKNIPDAAGVTGSYDYITDIVFAKESSNPADGNIDPVFQNKEQLPVDAFNHRTPYDFYLTPGIVAGTDKTATTETFHHVMQETGTFSQSTVDAVLGVKKIKIYDRATGVSGSPVAEFDVSVSR